MKNPKFKALAMKIPQFKALEKYISDHHHSYSTANSPLVISNPLDGGGKPTKYKSKATLRQPFADSSNSEAFAGNSKPRVTVRTSTDPAKFRQMLQQSSGVKFLGGNSYIPAVDESESAGVTGGSATWSVSDSDCSSLKHLSLPDCSSLESLCLSGFSTLKSISLGHCPSLVSLSLSGCSSLVSLYLSGSSSLVSLSITDCSSLDCLSLPHRSSLESFSLRGCSSLLRLNLSGSSLKFLDLPDPSTLKFLDLSSCCSLESLCLSDFSTLDSISLGHCPSLVSLSLSGCSSLVSLNLSHCSSLESLYLSGCHSLEYLHLSSCSSLLSLSLRGCSFLILLDLSFCCSLESLSLSCCHSLKNLHLSSCSSLLSLSLRGCSSLILLDLTDRSLKDYCSLDSWSLSLSNQPSLKSLSLTDIYSLDSLYLSHCSSLETLSLSHCSSLETLSLSHCSSLESLSLSHCSSLESLSLNHCSSLKPFSLADCPSLVSLSLSHCSSLESLSILPPTTTNKFDDFKARPKEESMGYSLSFVPSNSKEHKDYNSNAWRRGYFFCDSPATDRSCLIAATANCLEFDVYDLDLTGAFSVSELTNVLVSISNRSLIAIKDVDRWLAAFKNELSSTHLSKIIHSLLPSCEDEQIIVLTANHNPIERVDPALLRRLNIDLYSHMSSPQPKGLPDGGEILFLDSSSKQKLLSDPDVAYRSGADASRSDGKLMGESLKRECITKSSMLGLEDLQQHSAGRRDDAAKSFCGIHMCSLARISFGVLETLLTQERHNDRVPLLSMGALALEDCIEQEKSPDLPRVTQISGVEQRVTKLPGYMEGLTAQSASSSHWPTGLPDGGHIALLDPSDPSTTNLEHVAWADQCSPAVSFAEEIMMRKTLKGICRNMSVIFVENHHHFATRCKGNAKSLSATHIFWKHGINQVQLVKQIDKQHRVCQWPFQQSAIRLPDGHVLPVSETLKRKFRTMSVLGSEDHQQHADRRWDDTAESLAGISAVKRICRQLVHHRVSTAKRIRRHHGIRRWLFQQDWATVYGCSSEGHSGEILGRISVSSSGFDATNNTVNPTRRERRGSTRQDRSGSTASHSENNRTRETARSKRANITLTDLQQCFSLSRQDTADKLSVSVSTLKRALADHKIRWPYKRGRSVRKPPQGSNTSQMSSSHGQIEMENQMADLPSGPNELLPTFSGPFWNTESSVARISETPPFYDASSRDNYIGMLLEYWYATSQMSSSHGQIEMENQMADLPSGPNELLPTFSGPFWNTESSVARISETPPFYDASSRDNCLGMLLEYLDESGEGRQQMNQTTMSTPLEGHGSRLPTSFDPVLIQPSSNISQTVPTTPLAPSQDTSYVVKATYGEDIVIFELPRASGIIELKDNVAKRLDLDRDGFSLKYKDKEDDLILISCDEDLRYHLRTVGSQDLVRLSVTDKRRHPVVDH